MKRNVLLIFGLLFIFSSSVFAQVDNTSKVSTNTVYQTKTVKASKDVLLSEDFSSWLPTGWTNESGASSTASGDELWHDGGGMAQILYVAGNMSDEYLFTPVITVPAGTATLTWDWMGSYYWMVDPYDGADLMVKISTDGGSTWSSHLWIEDDETMVTNSGVVWPWVNFTYYTSTIDISAYAGQDINIAFHYLGNDGAQTEVDNVVVEGESVGTYTVTFTVDDGTDPLQDVLIDIDGETYTATTDVNGVATFDLEASTYSFTVTLTGYTYTGTTTFEVVDQDIDIAVTMDEGSYVNDIATGISIYPNPSNGVFNVNVENNFNLEVFDITGKVINTQVLTGNSTVEINTAGVYFFRFSNENGSVTQRVIVQ
ncbi:MAG: T9SS type A sorting domain-containing protein [Bacteroidales bacterium]|nr:T9SS type A sorting domain-containing protein [Bacteroidales bacterium]